MSKKRTPENFVSDWKKNWILDEESEQRKENLFMITHQSLEISMADEVLSLLIKDEKPEIRESSFEFIRGIELLTNLFYLKNTRKSDDETIISVSSNFGVNGNISKFNDWLKKEDNVNKINRLLSHYIGWQIFEANMENATSMILPVSIDIEKFFELNIEDRNSMSYYTLNNLLNPNVEKDSHALEYWKGQYSIPKSEHVIFKTSTHFHFQTIQKQDYQRLTNYVLNSKEKVEQNDIQNSLNSFWNQEIKKIFTENESTQFKIEPPMGFQNTIEYAVQQQIFSERAKIHNIEAIQSYDLNLMPNIQRYQVEMTSEKIAVNIETFDGSEQIKIPNNASILTHLTPEDFKKNIHQSLIKPEVLIHQENQAELPQFKPQTKPTLH